MLHDANFLATCNAVQLLRDVKFGNYASTLHFCNVFFAHQIYIFSRIVFALIWEKLSCSLVTKLTLSVNLECNFFIDLSKSFARKRGHWVKVNNG